MTCLNEDVDVKDILKYFSLLDELTLDCEPAFHPVELKDKTREDAPKPTTMDCKGYIRGPKVV